MLQWETGDAKNVPVEKFYLEYKTSKSFEELFREDAKKSLNGYIPVSSGALAPTHS